MVPPQAGSTGGPSGVAALTQRHGSLVTRRSVHVRTPDDRATSGLRWIVPKPSGLAFSRASHPTIHRPSRPAGAPAPAGRPGDQPEVVLAPGDAGRLRRHRPRDLARRAAATRSRPSAPSRRARLAGAGLRQALRADARAGPRRPGAVPHRRRAGSRRRPATDAPEGDRLLLTGVRHHLGAAAVLRRSRHPRRRPPEDGQRPRRAADRRRPALPERLLPPAVLARGLAAGDLPGARPRRPADHAASRGETEPPRRCDSSIPGDSRAGGAHLRRPGRPGAAAAARHRRRGQPDAAARGHRPALRRHDRAPAPAGAAARRRRRTRGADVHPAHRPPRARGVPHQRGPRRLPGPRADPRADRRRRRSRARLRHRARGHPGRHGLHHAHPGARGHRPVPARAGGAVLRRAERRGRRPHRPDPATRRRGLLAAATAACSTWP